MRRSNALLVASSLVAFASLLATRDASAWCRTTTTQGFEPTTAKPCDDTGRPIYWSTKCVGFSVQRDASNQIDLTKAREIAQKAFDEWSKVDCTACGSAGSPSIKVTDIGPINCSCVEYNGKVGNANAIIFRDEAWAECNGDPKSDADTTLALTTVTYNVETGEIYDADMEVNTANNPITIDDPPGRVLYDYYSIMTHEAGHFLGLAHTQPTNTAATMYARYEQRKTYMRDPSADDICGICTAYPPKRATVCDSAPRRGLALECGGGDPETVTKGGCKCSVPGTAESGGGAVALAAGGITLFVGLIARRRRRGV